MDSRRASQLSPFESGSRVVRLSSRWPTPDRVASARRATFVQLLYTTSNMSYTSQSRRRTIDVDASGSSASDSLAEWSQKIKSLQQQVDEDGLQEQARLEAEIAKSRMERARRRSTLTGNARIDQGRFLQAKD